jgi:uncharacterized protein YjiS (DUF1127 family)
VETIMSDFSGGISSRKHAGASRLRRMGDALKRCWLAYMDWRLQQLTIRRLTRMSDRELKDVGLTRSQIEVAVRGEVVKHPMWSSHCF